MQNETICLLHNEPFQLICTGCNKLLCVECADDHDFISHKGKSISLKKFAKEIMIPAYETQLAEFDSKKSEMYKAVTNIFSILPTIVEKLNDATKKLDLFSSIMKKFVNELQPLSDSRAQISVENKREEIINKIKEIKDALSNGNLKPVIRAKTEFASNFIRGIGDSEIKLIEDIKSGLEQAKEMGILQKLEGAIGELVKLCNEFSSKRQYYTLSPEHKHKSIILTNNNLTAENNLGSNASVFGTLGFSTGRHEWGITCDKFINCDHGFGIGTDINAVSADYYSKPSLLYNPSKGMFHNCLGENLKNEEIKPIKQGSSVKLILDCDNGILQFVGPDFDAKIPLTKGKTYYPLLFVCTGDKWTLNPVS